jgi:TrmH family RNA methyltransferase
LPLAITVSLQRIRIVLVAPSHGGNIGGCARAMKNMGLTRLYLVAPEDFPGAEATARAVGAEDVLNDARVFAGLDEAIADCQLVVGTSARDRSIPWPLLAPAEAAPRLVQASATREVAVLFGRERTGLSNDELDRCQWLLSIPSHPDFSSLNLACAVQVVAYEIWRAGGEGGSAIAEAAEPLGEPFAARAEVERMYRHLEQVLVETGFLDPHNPRLLMRRLTRLFNRVELTTNEVNILRGILTSVQQHRSRADT